MPFRLLVISRRNNDNLRLFAFVFSTQNNEIMIIFVFSQRNNEKMKALIVDAKYFASP